MVIFFMLYISFWGLMFFGVSLQSTNSNNSKNNTITAFNICNGLLLVGLIGVMIGAEYY